MEVTLRKQTLFNALFPPCFSLLMMMMVLTSCSYSSSQVPCFTLRFDNFLLFTCSKMRQSGTSLEVQHLHPIFPALHCRNDFHVTACFKVKVLPQRTLLTFPLHRLLLLAWALLASCSWVSPGSALSRRPVHFLSGLWSWKDVLSFS